MEQILINLVAGALGGVGVGKSSPPFDLGMIGNIISGLIGGGVLGQIVTLLLPAITAAAQSGNLSDGGIISQAIAGGAAAAILTANVGTIKNKATACGGSADATRPRRRGDRVRGRNFSLVVGVAAAWSLAAHAEASGTLGTIKATTVTLAKMEVARVMPVEGTAP